MSEQIIAKRYADALFQLAEEKNVVDEIRSELNVLDAVFKEHPSFIGLLNHPKISSNQKLTLVDEVFGQCHEQIKNTIKLLVERHRIEHIGAIAEHFTNAFHEVNGIAAATIQSVRPLSDGEIAQLKTSLMNQLQKTKVTIENKTDSSLLGGLKIRVGNTIYDGSISGKLHRLNNNIGTKAI